MSRKIIVMLGVLLSLSACGFEPMYAESSKTSNMARASKPNLSQITIGIIPDAEGVYLRNELIDRFYHSGYPSAPTHSLKIQRIHNIERDFDITIDSETTRRQLILKTTMALIDSASGKEILQRNVKAISSYDVIGSQFTTRVAQQDAREAALNDIARQIELQLTLFLNR